MRKVLTTALAAVTAAGAVLATAAPAQADRYRHHRHKDNDDAVAAAVLGGVAGLALGAALSSKSDRSRGYYYNGYSYDPRYERYRGGYYRDGYYRDGYYRDGYYRGRPYAYHDRPYRTCITRDRVYDPYIGRRVTIERRYAC